MNVISYEEVDELSMNYNDELAQIGVSLVLTTRTIFILVTRKLLPKKYQKFIKHI